MVHSFCSDRTDVAAILNLLILGCIVYLCTTVPHPHGHWQLQELLGDTCTCTAGNDATRVSVTQVENVDLTPKANVISLGDAEVGGGDVIDSPDETLTSTGTDVVLEATADRETGSRVIPDQERREFDSGEAASPVTGLQGAGAVPSEAPGRRRARRSVPVNDSKVMGACHQCCCFSRNIA